MVLKVKCERGDVEEGEYGSWTKGESVGKFDLLENCGEEVDTYQERKPKNDKKQVECTFLGYHAEGTH